ncbi:phenylalanine--tRNA ligase subunit alpha [bacterium E08(2017)]|nr:phenylalanine--tRNA ligase subunit alpha [bacterium E08(2017)]
MNIEELKAKMEEGIAEANAVDTREAVEAVRIKYLGRKGLLPQAMKMLKEAEATERAEIGKGANIFKQKMNAILQEKADSLDAAAGTAPGFDCSIPGRWQALGSTHPISAVIKETVDIFRSLGFTVADGPDIETRYRNYTALNTPEHHPSMDEQDTFWIEGDDLLLRTQTSPVQVRVMEKQEPPVRIVTPGRCYRRDTTDATHSANFHQIEGLYVDRKVSLADLKGVLAHFAHKLMGPKVSVRFRPHFFPFTEPSVECDFSCHVCGGDGCRVCKNSGWIEIAGAGMVDPRVFEMVGYDPEEFTGYAFGMGIERIVMVKYGVPDIRMLYENDLRFLEQFGR